MRQQYKETTWQFALSQGCDIVQPKYDGIWCCVKNTTTSCQYISRTGTIKKETPPISDHTFELIGEYMFGSEWAQDPSLKDKVFIFDLIELNGFDLRERPYEFRLSSAMELVQSLDNEIFLTTPTFKASLAEKVWIEFVETRGFEGIVLRKLTDPWDAFVYKAKQVHTKEFYIIAFHEGDRRLSDTLGAIGVATEPSGPELFRVGGGFTDQERDFIWSNQGSLYNAKVLIEGRRIFESGKMRHPNFVKFL
jgi:hypothetical protein